MKAFAENCRRQITDESSRTIVPAESYVREWGATCTLRESGISPTGGDFQPVVFVCVTYETMFSKELHQTARPYYVEQSGRAFRTDDGPVAKEKLSVIVAGSGIATWKA